jgi:DNA-binding CsgD family transcriptional regulator
VYHLKVDYPCVFLFMRSLSAERSAVFVRILITITPRMYREVLALSIHRRYPDFEVLLSPPWPLDGRAERFGPHVLVQDADEAGLPPALTEGVLSARELEILLLASRGLSNRQIAARVNLAEGTVKRHLTNTYQKMGVGSRGQATRKALYKEWITIQDVTDDLDGPEGEQ